jgi:hypothetical protein
MQDLRAEFYGDSTHDEIQWYYDRYKDGTIKHDDFFQDELGDIDNAEWELKKSIRKLELAKTKLDAIRTKCEEELNATEAEYKLFLDKKTNAEEALSNAKSKLKRRENEYPRYPKQRAKEIEEERKRRAEEEVAAQLKRNEEQFLLDRDAKREEGIDILTDKPFNTGKFKREIPESKPSWFSRVFGQKKATDPEIVPVIEPEPSMFSRVFGQKKRTKKGGRRRNRKTKRSRRR